MVTISKAIEHERGQDKTYPIQGDMIIKLVQLVLNNGQGVYNFEDELDPAEEEWLERANTWRNEELYGKTKNIDAKDSEA